MTTDEKTTGNPIMDELDVSDDMTVDPQKISGKSDEGQDAIGQLQQELEAAGRKAAENLELAQRTQAEMENLRKRMQRDIENAHKYALEKFVLDLLPVIDSLELGINASSSAENVTALREGMDLTLKKFIDTLEKFGVMVVDPAGEKFNPGKHDAVSTTEAADVEVGTVISVLQKGFELNGRLVRPAMVVVSR